MRISILLIALMFVFTITAKSQIAVIANKSVSAASIDKGKLSSLYNLESKDLGGTKVALFDYKTAGSESNALYGYIGTDATNIKKNWMKAKMTGTGAPPTQVGSADEMLSKVASTPGAIGFVPESKVSGDVKVLLKIN